MLRVMSRDENIADWDAFCDGIEVKSRELGLQVEPRGHWLLGDSILGKVKSYRVRKFLMITLVEMFKNFLRHFSLDF